MTCPTELLIKDAESLRLVLMGILKSHFLFLSFLTQLCVLLWQDLQLGIEIFIETIFDFFHKAAHLLLSPSETFGIVLSWFSSSSHSSKGNYGDVSDDEIIQTAILGDNDSSLTERRTTTSLYNTDTRTCQDVITELG